MKLNFELKLHLNSWIMRPKVYIPNSLHISFKKKILQILQTGWDEILFQSISFSHVPQSSTDIGEPLLSDMWISLFGGAGEVVIRLQEGGGSWRLIGNRAPVNVNGNQGFVQPWLTLYTDPSTQDKLTLTVTLLAPLPHPLHPLKGKEDRNKRGGEVVRHKRNTKGEQKEECLTFQTFRCVIESVNTE